MKFTITGPHCASCTALIEDVLDEMGLTPTTLKLDQEAKTATLELEEGDAEQVAKSIKEETGYEVVRG